MTPRDASRCLRVLLSFLAAAADRPSIEWDAVLKVGHVKLHIGGSDGATPPAVEGVLRDGGRVLPIVAARTDDTSSDRASAPSVLTTTTLPNTTQERFPRCDTGIVAARCALVGHMAGTTSVLDISYYMSSTMNSAEAFLESLDLAMGPKGAISCQELCEKIMESIDPSELPFTSDVACRHSDPVPDDPHAKREVVCDVDVSSVTLEGVVIPEEHDNFHNIRPVQNDAADDPEINLDHHDEAMPEFEEVSFADARIKLANLFRVYPMVSIDSDHADDTDDETTTTTAEAVQSVPEVRKTGVNITEKRAWALSVEMLSAKAQAYVSRAISLVRKDHTFLQKWFGNSDEGTRNKVTKVLNDIQDTLVNVAYRNGTECEPGLIAYVYSRGPKAKSAGGKFILNLCSAYFAASEGDAIETLTHEGSHHANGFTEDVCDGEIVNSRCLGHRAYGRTSCESLARRYPKRALVNADSYCYYINDLNRFEIG